MADKTPVRVVFNASNVATGMAEFQSGDTVPISHGGTGLSAIGSAGQLLKVNAAGNALEFASDGDFTITNLLAPSNADLTLKTSGTGGIILNDITISDNSISTNRSNDDFKINASGTGTVILENLKVGTSGSTVTTILDEDNMSSDSATSLATQQSIKAYVDSEVSAVSTNAISQGDSNVTVADSGTGNVTIEVDGTDRITTVAATTTTATGHSLVIGAGSASAGGQIKFLEGTDNGTNGVTLIGPASTADVTVTLPAATDTLVGKATTDTFTNKTFDVEATGNSISNIDVADLKSGVLDTDISSVSGSDDTLASAKAIKTYADTKAVLSGSTDNTITTVTGSNAIQGESNLTFDGTTLAVTGAVTISGNLTVNGDTTTVNTSNTTISDNILELNTGISQSLNDAGIIIERGSTGNNAAIIWDESADTFVLGTTTAEAGDKSGGITIDAGSLQVATLQADGVTITDNTITSNSSNANLEINANGTGTIVLENLKVGSSGSTVTGILDEDNLSSDSATALATQQSIKAYVDAQITAEDLDVTADDSTAIAIDLDSEVLHFAGGNGISTSVSGKTVTTAIDTGTVVTLSDSQTLTNKVLTSPTITTPTVNGTLTATSVTTNDIVSNGSNADINITPTGTGGVVITSGGVAFTLPTADGDNGDVLKTDGAGTLTFAASEATPSDDTRVTVKNNKSMSTSARTMDYFQSTSADMAWYFVALNDLTNDHSSASCFTVAHNDSDAFIGGPRGGVSGTANTLPSTSADISSGQVRVKITAPSDDSKVSFYKIPISRANTSDATAGVTITTSNTDVDSASESIDTFAHASFRAAKYTILIDNDSKTETGVTEALVVHNGTNAFVTQYGTVNTGSNDMITLSAAISGSNVVLSAAGLEPNLSLKIHKTLLSDSMTAVSNANQKIIAATTVSSSATAFDNFDLDDATAALYYVVGGNASEGAFSVQEVFCSGAPGEASVSEGPHVSTKGTHQLSFTAGFKSDADNSLELSVASTSGGSTTVNAYRINCLAE